jgi:hypothetical protein
VVAMISTYLKSGSESWREWGMVTTATAKQDLNYRIRSGMVSPVQMSKESRPVTTYTTNVEQSGPPDNVWCNTVEISKLPTAENFVKTINNKEWRIKVGNNFRDATEKVWVECISLA